MRLSEKFIFKKVAIEVAIEMSTRCRRGLGSAGESWGILATGNRLDAKIHRRGSLVAGIVGGRFLVGGRNDLVHYPDGLDVGLVVVGNVAGCRMDVRVTHQLRDHRQMTPFAPKAVPKECLQQYGVFVSSPARFDSLSKRRRRVSQV